MKTASVRNPDQWYRRLFQRKLKRLSKYCPFNDDERFYQYHEHKQPPQASKYLII
jgi:hypothetical protein